MIIRPIQARPALAPAERPLRVAYLVHWPAGVESGVFQKIVAQCRTWMRSGVTVRAFVLCPSEQRDAWIDALGSDVVMRVARSGSDRVRRSNDLVRDVMRWSPDLVYRRQGSYYPALAWLARRHPLVLEVNTDDVHEGRDRGGIRFWYHLATRGALLRHCAGAVFVSHELADRPRFRRHVQRSVVIANGCDLKTFSRIRSPRTGPPRLVFLGTPNHAWHGIDKLSVLASRFPAWRFDVIGAATHGIDPPANVVTHAALAPAAYRQILAQADVALGTLALHRMGMDEASPLKMREYLAAGVPSILAYRDTDFPEPQPFLLQLPNTPDNVETHAPLIARFVESARTITVPSEAVEHLDHDVKERRRLAFFVQIVSATNGRRRPRLPAPAATPGGSR